ncbi:hypothetical protein LXA54_16945 [Erwinia amylovora]|uniref:hypothetical protein n=1 Tax=Erwinia amylovora TaxID=552 RepID=UPI0020BED7D9|nr:hypothetical protein [Erwinia amylovora]MCK8335977.1 hypothetical protein [Erwinia amylovora]
MPYCLQDEIESLQTLLASNCQEGASVSPAVSSLLDQAKALQLKAVSLLSEAFASYEVRTSDHEQSDFEYTALQQLDLIERFDAIRNEDLDYERKQALSEEREALRISELPPSGFTMTNTELHDAAKRIVTAARQYFGVSPAPLEAHVWAYRFDGCTMLSCDLQSLCDVTKAMPITITASGFLEVTHPDQPQVYDMAEALHLVGLVTRSLNAKVVIGRVENETNDNVLHKPLKVNETNGCIELWSQE